MSNDLKKNTYTIIYMVTEMHIGNSSNTSWEILSLMNISIIKRNPIFVFLFLYKDWGII